MTQIETFLSVIAAELTPHQRAKIRQIAMKAIMGGDIPRLPIPEHLRDPLRRLIIAAAYQKRVSGDIVDPMEPTMP